MEKFNYNFDNNSAFVEILNDIKKIYKVKIKNLFNNIIVYETNIWSNCWVRSSEIENSKLQINVYDENNLIFNVTEDKPFFAEFQTDKYIRENYFTDYSYKGTMIELGAGPPEFFSMSKHFRDNGWRCICIEPNPKFVQQHKELGNEIYQFACSNYEKKEEIFKIVDSSDLFHWDEKIDGVSLSALDIRQKYDEYDKCPLHEISVEVKKLNTILNDINVENIDFLSVDTEGWELEVMEGFDLDKYNPKIVLLENTEHDDKYNTYMKKFGYYLDSNISYNYIYKKI